jgi:hypothetical protein
MSLTLLRTLLAQNKHNDFIQNQKTGPRVTCGTNSYLKSQLGYYVSSLNGTSRVVFRGLTRRCVRSGKGEMSSREVFREYLESEQL